MKTCIVSFSGRPTGNCSRIAQLLRAKAPEAAVYDFSTLSVAPCGRCNYECFRQREKCPYFSDSAFAIYEAVANSDLAYFIVPNYCDYPCANFFSFNERSQCCFQQHAALEQKYTAVQKKFIVISNNGRENFIKVFRQHIPESCVPDILFLSAIKFGKISLDGDLTDSEKVREAISQFTE